MGEELIRVIDALKRADIFPKRVRVVRTIDGVTSEATVDLK